jgi:hypothetical protein
LACVLRIESLPENVLAFRANVEIVTVPFTVVDENGAAVSDLTRDEFRA